MPELDSISIYGFRSLRSVSKLELRRVNLVIGPNGSGKSNFISVFSFLRHVREGKLQQYVQSAGGANRLLTFGTKTTPEMRMRLSFQGGVNEYEIALAANAEDELVPRAESAYFWDKQRYPTPYSQRVAPRGKEAGISGGNTKIQEYVRTHLAQWRLYHFHDTSSSSPLKRTQDLSDNRYLREDGSNLASFLYMLQRRHPSEYQLVRKTIELVAPFFDDFVLAPNLLNQEKIKLEWKHKRSDAYFDAASLSDGTLRFMALATLLLQPPALRPSVILIDEPELGLHPYAIKLLASLITQASVDTQAIVSTQSSLLLDEFEPEDVIVANLEDGATTLRRLDPGPLKEWLGEYSLGQLWEKNEFGGRPG